MHKHNWTFLKRFTLWVRKAIRFQP